MPSITYWCTQDISSYLSSKFLIVAKIIENLKCFILIHTAVVAKCLISIDVDIIVEHGIQFPGIPTVDVKIANEKHAVTKGHKIKIGFS